MPDGTDGISVIDGLIQSIVYNADIHNLMMNPAFVSPLQVVFQFQDIACGTALTTLNTEGFQVGEPFDGDIEHAPVLFLSSNPGFKFEEVSPRYHSRTGQIVMPAHIDVITQTPVPEHVMTLQDVKNFFTWRIVTSPVSNDNPKTLRIPLKDGNTEAVSYWTSARKNTELLLPTALRGTLGALPPSLRVRQVMSYATCMEIVPFRSNGSIGVTPASLNFCWNNFTMPLLSLSGAEVIVLVGNNALNTFSLQMGLTVADVTALQRYSIIQVPIGGKVRQVVKVKSYRGPFDDFNNVFPPAVIANLQAAVAASPIFAHPPVPAPTPVSVSKTVSKADDVEIDEKVLGKLSQMFSPDDFVSDKN